MSAPARWCATTAGVRVCVEPRFLPDRSDPAAGLWVWAYVVEIANLGTEHVRLVSRHWRIVDAAGRTEIVEGPGVVGQTPDIPPGGAHTYVSGCPLHTPSGLMSGHYIMRATSGGAFMAEIPAFSLDSPDMPRVLN